MLYAVHFPSDKDDNKINLILRDLSPGTDIDFFLM